MHFYTCENACERVDNEITTIELRRASMLRRLGIIANVYKAIINVNE
jgi:hypothetical protein